MWFRNSTHSVMLGITVVFGLALFTVYMVKQSQCLNHLVYTHMQIPDAMLPSDDEMAKMSDNSLLGLYWNYINRLQVLCKNVIRLGSLWDGGKEICADEPYRPRPPCTVYSFGIGNNFEFDEAVVNEFGCNVYCFDPSINKTSQQISDHIWFYDWGLGSKDWVTSTKWQIKTLHSIRKKLGHLDKPIDILKMDIEGDEWNSIPQMIATRSLDDIKQIAMETHFYAPGIGSENVPGRRQLPVLRELYDAGFRIFMRDRNLVSARRIDEKVNKKYVTALNEISLIKVH